MENKNNLVIKFIEESEKEYKKIFNSGEYFNIFNELSITTDEVKHSSILKSLINPNGFHGCGDLFYYSFLKEIKIDTQKEEFDWLNDTKNIKIHAEYFIGNRNHKNNTSVKYYGRIDLLIENSEKKKAIVIENKIYAKDQDKQLKRYADFATEKYGKINQDFWLYYLTLDNDKFPEIQSYEGIEKKDINCISYQNEISNWLEYCLNIHYINPSKQPLNLNIQEIVRQYRNTVYQLTKQPRHINFDLKWLNKNYPTLTENDIVSKRDELRKDFFINLRNNLIEKLPNVLVDFVEKIHNSVNINEALKSLRHVRNFGIRIGNNEEDYFYIEVKDWSILIYGKFAPNKENEKSKLLENLGFVYKPWWLLKEFDITNSSNVKFPFYNDNLNYSFLKNAKTIAKEFSEEIASVFLKITK